MQITKRTMDTQNGQVEALNHTILNAEAMETRLYNLPNEAELDRKRKALRSEMKCICRDPPALYAGRSLEN